MIDFKYKGSCDSLYYKFVQSPLCDWIADRLPMWLAPNLITLSGFACTLSCKLLMLYLYGFSTEGPVDSWFCYLLGISYFVYSTIDNVDGKQARRTGSGSPMGMLFDHGLDATTAVLGATLLSRLF